MKVNPGREQELVDGAAKDTMRQLKERCLRAKAEGRSSADAARAHEAIRQARRCRTWTDTDGAFRLDALLTPDAGAQLLASLTKESDRFFKEARTAGLFEPTQAYAADASVALVTGRTDGNDPTDRGSPPQPRSSDRDAAQSEADSAGPAAPASSADPAEPAGSRHASSSCGAGWPPAHIRGRSRLTPSATVHLRVDLDALRRGSVAEGDICEIPGVGPVPIETARSLMGMR